jgi:hypothetical protein
VGYGIGCLYFEALPSSDFAAGVFVDAGIAAVDVITKNRNGQQGSNHRSPPGVLSRHVDAHVAAQVGIGVFTAVVLFAGVNMTVVVVVEVILSTCIFHGYSPRFAWLCVVVLLM